MRSPAATGAGPRRGPDPEFRCPCCNQLAPVAGSQICAICRKRVCPACLRPYGHHMMVCEDCRLAEW